MLSPNSMMSFYLDDELIDVSYLMWENRHPNGARNHKRIQALTSLRLTAEFLLMGDDQVKETDVQRWLKEIAR